MRTSHTAKALRFALATLLLGLGVGFLLAGGMERLKEDRDDSTGTGADIEPAHHGEAERGWVVMHGPQCSAQSGAGA